MPYTLSIDGTAYELPDDCELVHERATGSVRIRKVQAPAVSVLPPSVKKLGRPPAQAKIETQPDEKTSRLEGQIIKLLNKGSVSTRGIVWGIYGRGASPEKRDALHRTLDEMIVDGRIKAHRRTATAQRQFSLAHHPAPPEVRPLQEGREAAD